MSEIVNGITILAERSVAVPSTAWRVIGLVCAAMILIAWGLAHIIQDDTARIIFACLMMLFGIIGILVVIFNPFWAQETQYLIQVTDDASYTKFNELYEVKEKISDTIFWCVPN